MKGVIAAGDYQSANAGAWALKQGGNAFDALIAAILAAPICEPVFTSLGGGGFLMAASPNQKPKLYDFFVDVPPVKENREFFPVYVDFGKTVQEFHIGAASAAIPGVIAGIQKVHQERATLPLETLIQPALKYAKDGIKLSKIQASFIRLLEPIFTSTAQIRALYAPNGKLIDENHLFKNPQYADFLEAFAKNGADIFYKGVIGKDLESLCQEKGGLIDSNSLENYQVHVREPLEFEFDGFQAFTNPPPSSGGILIAFTLELLKDINLGTFGSKNHVLKLLEALHVTSDFRKEHVDSALHSSKLATILKNQNLLQNYKISLNSRLNLWGNTTHISVMDANGNAASATTTNGEACGHVIPQTGILLNNMLGEEDLNPHGFFKWPSGVRLPSMMAPTMLCKDGLAHLVLGSAGSNRIRSAIVNTILGVTRFDKTIQEAISAPRLHLEQNQIFLEPNFCVDPSFLEARYTLTTFSEKNLYFGGVQGVTSNLQGGADPRRGAAVINVK